MLKYFYLLQIKQFFQFFIFPWAFSNLEMTGLPTSLLVVTPNKIDLKHIAMAVTQFCRKLDFPVFSLTLQFHSKTPSQISVRGESTLGWQIPSSSFVTLLNFHQKRFFQLPALDIEQPKFPPFLRSFYSAFNSFSCSLPTTPFLSYVIPPGCSCFDSPCLL